MDSSTTTSTTTSTMTMTVAELEAACHAHWGQLEGCESFLTIYDELTDEGDMMTRTSRGQVEFEELRRAFYTYYLTLVHENPKGSIDEKNDRKRKRKGCEGCEGLQSLQEEAKPVESST